MRTFILTLDDNGQDPLFVIKFNHKLFLLIFHLELVETLEY